MLHEGCHWDEPRQWCGYFSLRCAAGGGVSWSTGADLWRLTTGSLAPICRQGELRPRGAGAGGSHSCFSDQAPLGDLELCVQELSVSGAAELTNGQANGVSSALIRGLGGGRPQ